MVFRGTIKSIVYGLLIICMITLPAGDCFAQDDNQPRRVTPIRAQPVQPLQPITLRAYTPKKLKPVEVKRVQAAVVNHEMVELERKIEAAEKEIRHAQYKLILLKREQEKLKASGGTVKPAESETTREVESAGTTLEAIGFGTVLPSTLDSLEVHEPNIVSKQFKSVCKAMTMIDYPDGDYATVDVFYATNRNIADETTPTKIEYGAKTDTIHYGQCKISIPRDHRMGYLESPLFEFDFCQDPEKHVLLLETTMITDKAAYFNDIKTRVGNCYEKSALIFVHGFNVSFEDAAKRTGQMAYDLAFDGAPVFYSWPSQASEFKYGIDAYNVQQSEPKFVEFLRDFSSESDADKIYLIAHSMGTRLLTGALCTLFAEDENMKDRFESIVLAAPDIDAEVFKTQIAPKFASLPSTRVTLYASENDKAMAISRVVHHGYPRAGDSKHGIVIADGVYSIDATNVVSDFVGHSYYGNCDSVLSDIFYIVGSCHLVPQQRFGLASAQNAQGQYWEFKHR